MKKQAASFRNPHNLPVKECSVCKRPFHWRKKWARDWESVQYCSEQCRRTASANRHKEKATG